MSEHKYQKLSTSSWFVKIIHFNDCYQIAKTPYFIEKIKEVQKDHIIMFSGDLFFSSMESVIFKGK